MNAEIIAIKSGIVERNCGKCCHNDVCQYKNDFDALVGRVLHEAQGNCLLEIDIKCKYHMYKGGTTYKVNNDLETHMKAGENNV